MNNLANMLFLEGRHGDDEELAREALAIQRRVLGPDHPDTAMSTYDLGGITLHKGKRDEALSLLRDAVDHGLAPNIALHLESDPDRGTAQRPTLLRPGCPRQRTRRGCAKTKLVALGHWRKWLAERSTLWRLPRDSRRVTGNSGWPTDRPKGQSRGRSLVRLYVCGTLLAHNRVRRIK